MDKSDLKASTQAEAAADELGRISRSLRSLTGQRRGRVERSLDAIATSIDMAQLALHGVACLIADIDAGEDFDRAQER